MLNICIFLYSQLYLHFLKFTIDKETAWYLLLKNSHMVLLQIILKHCRETHCAFCFNELQADTVPCVSCSIPLYCSLKCQVQAGGEDFLKYKAEYGFKLDLSDDLERHIRNVTSPSFSSPDVKHFAEHRHECQGMHWPAVLPSDVVLAGRIIVKHIEEQAYGGLDHNVHKILVLFAFFISIS